MRERNRQAADRDAARDSREEGDAEPVQAFWQWFAVGMLLFCWLAEASMCGLRGY